MRWPYHIEKRSLPLRRGIQGLEMTTDKYIDIEEPEDQPPGGNEVDPTYIGAQNTQGPEVTLVEERDDDYKEFRDKLIDAYDILFKQNQISWLH